MDPQTAAAALKGKPDRGMEAAFSVPFPMPKAKEKGKDMRDIHFIRHGATEYNNDDVSVDRMRGWKDIPLSKDGREEAHKLGENLKGGEAQPDSLHTSDLHRAAETANIISQITGTPVAEVSEAFRPWNVGDLAGKSSKEGIPILAEYSQNKPDEPVPGGESFNDFMSRFFGGLHSTLENSKGAPGIVAHHRNERALHSWAKAGHPADGSIDMSEFNKKGEHTGAITKLSIPMDRLRAAAQARNGKGVKGNGSDATNKPATRN